MMTDILDFFKSAVDTTISMQWNDIVEMIIMALLIYGILVWVKNSRTFVIIKGVIVIVLFYALAQLCQFNTILYLFDKAFSVLLIALIVIFQPEIRAAIERLGKGRVVRFFSKESETALGKSGKTVDEVIKGVYALSGARTGALIVLERVDSLDEYVKTGISVDAQISSQLLINIFEHNTPLHDGAVIISKNRIVAATCYLPLSDSKDIPKNLGTRHRAGIGVSEATDSATIIVSEETGHVSLAIEGKLSEDITQAQLREVLNDLEKGTETVGGYLQKIRRRSNEKVS